MAKKSINHLIIFSANLCLLLISASVSAAAGLTPVTTRPLQELVIFPVRDSPATTVSINDARISAETTGTIIEIPVQVGDIVDEGALVASLDCQDHVLAADQVEAQMKAAQAQADFARHQLERAQKLVQTKAVSEEMLAERQAQARGAAAEVERLSAALKAAQREVTKCEIRAPFKAVLIERIASVGEFATPGMQIMRLLDQEHLEVRANVQEQDLKSLRAAQSVRFVSGQRSYPLRLRTVIPMVETRLRTHEVRFSFIEAKPAPGEAGRIKWVSAQQHLPSDLLVRRDGKLGVFIEDERHARFRSIEGAQEGHPALLDLPGNTSIIVDGRFGLTDGDPIQIVSL